ncbi:MAG TPA: hypothetical protein VLJ58_14240, partial [Ramlibacter sp.]|nr:hypothetical protein [Ramlibacter sp.]
MDAPRQTPGLRLTVLLVLVLVALSTVLIALRLEQVLLEFARERGLHVAYHLKSEMESELRRGVPAASRWQLDASIGRYEALDPSLVAAGIQHAGGSQRAERYADDTSLLLLNPAWTRQLLQGHGGPAYVLRDIGALSFIGVPVAEPSGRRVAALWLVYDRKLLRDAGRAALEALLPWAAGAAAVL